MGNHFAETTPWEIREQILKYNATFSMSDAERAVFLGLPEGCRIRENAKILSQDKLVIGRHCWIGESAILDASGGLTIGDNTSIGLGVFVWTHDSYRLNIRGTNTRDSSHRIIRKPTKIGSNCFVGGPSVVMPGVTIGDKCIISPMSVVYNDLQDGTIYKPYEDMMRCHAQLQELRERIAILEKALASARSDE